jgi:hypothetical protein
VSVVERLFSVEGANALVPLLKQTFADVAAKRDEMHTHVEVLQSLGVNFSDEESFLRDELDPEVSGRLARCSELHESMHKSLENLIELGVEVKGLDGLVDVRSRVDGRIVYLCWKHGEDRFSHWHELDGGFSGRTPIADREAFEGTLLN